MFGHFLELLGCNTEHFDAAFLIQYDELPQIMEDFSIFGLLPCFPSSNALDMEGDALRQVNIVCNHPDSIEPSSLPGLFAWKYGHHCPLSVKLPTNVCVIHYGNCNVSSGCLWRRLQCQR